MSSNTRKRRRGDKVLALWHGEYYPATIEACVSNPHAKRARYKVLYDDGYTKAVGEQELKVQIESFILINMLFYHINKTKCDGRL